MLTPQDKKTLSSIYVSRLSYCLGPQDLLWNHNDIYCRFHYSTRFATKCAVRNSAIRKQFVETNGNNRDEC